MKKTILLLVAFAIVPVMKADVWRDPGTGVVWTYTSFGGKEAAIGDGRTAAIPTDTAGELTIPSSVNGLTVTGIEGYAFVGCSNLTKVVIPNSVEKMGRTWNFGHNGEYEFYYQDRTYDVDGTPPNIRWTDEVRKRLPHLVWEPAVSNGGSLYPKLVISGGPLNDEEIAYLNLLANKYCHQSAGMWCTTLYVSSFGGCDKITSVSLPSVDELAQVFPDAYDKITNVVITKCSHSSVMLSDMQLFNRQLIEGGAIGGLSGLCSLKEVSLPTDSVIISGKAFANCNRLESINLPSGIKVVGASAFYGCSSLKKVIVPEGAVGIEPLAFGNCLSLADVVIPDSVTYLEKVTYMASGTGVVSNMSSCAFLGCESIRRVSLPSRHALRDVFPNSYDKIQAVVLSDEPSTISAHMFKGCEALESIVIPTSVTSVDSGAFYKLSKLKNMTFLGDAPDFGEDVFYGTPRRMTLTVPEDSLGWTDYELWGVPPPWGMRSVVGGSGGETGGGGSGEPDPGPAVSVVVVSNIVVHYVMNSVMSPMAAPVTEDVGIVNVMTEIKGANVAIPDSWASNYPTFAQEFGTEFAAALTKPSGKTDASGNPMLVWQDYVAGTDPTDKDDVFKASVTIIDGKPVVGYTPELTEAERAKRIYKTYGKVRLGDAGWTLVSEGCEADYNFFKVTVEMK